MQHYEDKPATFTPVKMMHFKRVFYGCVYNEVLGHIASKNTFYPSPIKVSVFICFLDLKQKKRNLINFIVAINLNYFASV